MPNIWQRYAKDMSKISQRHAKDIPGVIARLKILDNYLKLTYAQDMPGVIPSLEAWGKGF